MIFQSSIFGILDYIRIGTEGLMDLLVFILVIFVAVSIKKKELEPDCKKGFSKFFIVFLTFLMFSVFVDFAFSLTYRILLNLAISGGIEDFNLSYYISIFSLITYVLSFLNKWIAYILLFSSIS